LRADNEGSSADVPDCVCGGSSGIDRELGTTTHATVAAAIWLVGCAATSSEALSLTSVIPPDGFVGILLATNQKNGIYRVIAVSWYSYLRAIWRDARDACESSYCWVMVIYFGASLYVA
jgi:hypothetical protein